MKEKCDYCQRVKEVSYEKKSNKKRCKLCYRKLFWKPKVIICQRCERVIDHHAKSLCAGCYNSVYHGDKARLHSAIRYHNIDLELYKKVIGKCAVCDFDKVVEMHHLDHNPKNNSEDNLAGLCPNHHKMLHTKEHQNEIFSILKSKGYKIPENSYTDGFYLKEMKLKS